MVPDQSNPVEYRMSDHPVHDKESGKDKDRIADSLAHGKGGEI